MPRAQTDVVILDGRRDGETSADPAFKTLTDEIASRGLPCRVFDLRAMPIGACNGCFGCWVKTPGQCVQDDPAREVARACARADLVVLFTPVTFGGYSSELKKAMDRNIPNLSPIFIRIRGETHHPCRYASRARLAALGVLEQPDEEEQRLFETVVHRNAINFHSPRQAASVVLAADGPERLRAAAAGLLDRVLGRGDRR